VGVFAALLYWDAEVRLLKQVASFKTVILALFQTGDNNQSLFFELGFLDIKGAVISPIM